MNIKEYVDGANDIIKEYNSKEGHMIPEQSEYIINFVLEHPQIKNVLEIGFNVGIGAATFLSARPDIKVLSIDIGTHEYIPAVRDYVQKSFPGRHSLIMGDSTVVVPELDLSEIDLFFIDGGHSHPVPEKDIYNCHKKAKPGTFVIIDDWCRVHGVHGVNQAVSKALAEGVMVAQDKQQIVNPQGHCRGWGVFKYS